MFLAAVDLGSNSFRLEIGRVEDGLVTTEHYWKESIHLASGLDASGALTAQMQQRALETLERFATMIGRYAPERVRAVGTQTLRTASNRTEFLALACQVLGHPIEIISGHEEARMVFSGCSHNLPEPDGRRLVIDIGGASTETIVGERYDPILAESFHVGCVNTSLEYFPQGKVTQQAMKQARLAAKAEFEEVRQSFRRSGWKSAYGCAGTVEAISQIGIASGMTDGTITAELLRHLRRALVKAGSVSRAAIPGLKSEREEVFAGGLAILSAAFDVFHIRQMRVAAGGLRAGLFYDMLGRDAGSDIRTGAVKALMKKTGVDAEQARRVRAHTLEFFSALSDGDPDPADAKMLGWAALLHECGRLVSTSGSHRHGSYIVRNSDMPGFSQDEQALLAELVLGSRGNLGKVQATAASRSRRRMLCALRLAMAFSNARRMVKLPGWKLEEIPGGFRLDLDTTRSSRESITAYLLEAEAAVWKRAGFVFELSLPSKAARRSTGSAGLRSSARSLAPILQPKTSPAASIHETSERE